MILSILCSFLPLNAQIISASTTPTASKSIVDPVEFLKESKCFFKGKGYSNYSVGYIVRSYVSAGRIRNLKWAKTLTGTSPKNWVVTLSYFDTKAGKKRNARWNFKKSSKTVVGGDSGNRFLSCVPGEKFTHWPGANQMDVIE